MYFVGSVSTKLMGVALIPIYAYSVGSADLGRYDYLLALGQISAPIFYIGIWESALRFLITHSDRDGSGRREYTSTIVFFALAMSAVAVGAGALAASVGLIGLVDCVALSAITVLTGLVQIWQYLCRAEGETSRFVSSGVGSGVVGFALVVLLVMVFDMDFAGLVISYVAAQFFALAWIELRLHLLARVHLASVSRAALGRMLRYSVPLFINLVALGLIGGFGKVLLVHVAGNAEAGVYSFAMKFATIVVTLGTIFSMSVIEEGMLRADSPALAHFYTQVINGFASLAMLFIAVLTPGLYWLFASAFSTTEYAAGDSLVPLLMLYAGLSVVSTQVGSVFMTVGRTSILGVSTVLGAFVTVVLSLLLVNPLGAHGVAAGLAMGAFCTLVIRVQISKAQISYHWKWPRFAVLLACYGLVCIAAETVSRSRGPLTLLLFSALVAIATAWPIFRSLRSIREVPDDVKST